MKEVQSIPGLFMVSGIDRRAEEDLSGMATVV